MNKRIAQLRKFKNLTQDEFAKRLNLSRNYVWMIEKGERTPADRTISDICREFRVNEKWLRTGEGEMEMDNSELEILNDFFADVLASCPDERSAFVAALHGIPKEFYVLAAELARKYAEALKKED